MKNQLNHDYLRSLIDTFLKENPKYNVLRLSQDAKIGAATLSRIVQGKSEITFETVWALLGAICENQEQLMDAVTHIYPDLARSFKPMWENEAEFFQQQDLKDLLRTRSGFIVINLAATDAGVTRSQIARLIGDEGFKVLSHLLESDCIVEHGDVYRMRSFCHSDVRSILDQIIVAAQLFNSALIGTTAAGLLLKTASVNTTGLELIKEVFIQARNSIIEISEKPQYSGSIPLFVTAMMNLLDEDPFIKGENR